MPTITWKGNPSLFTAGVNTVLVEQPDSPSYVFGKKCTRKFRGLHSLCLSSGVSPYTLGTGAMAGWYVTNCTVNRMQRQIGELVIEYAPVGGSGGTGGGSSLPADELSLDPFEINPRLETHRYFAPLTEAEREKVRRWVNSAVEESGTRAKLSLGGSSNQTLAENLGAKLIKGIESYYLAGITYTWSTYSWSIPGTMSIGGVIETPGGPLAGVLNTTAFAWLRQADSLSFDGSKYKLTTRWIGAPDSHWDPDLY